MIMYFWIYFHIILIVLRWWTYWWYTLSEMGSIVNDHICMFLLSSCIMVYGIQFSGELWFKSVRHERVADPSNKISEALLIQRWWSITIMVGLGSEGGNESGYGRKSVTYLWCTNWYHVHVELSSRYISIHTCMFDRVIIKFVYCSE